MPAISIVISVATGARYQEHLKAEDYRDLLLAARIQGLLESASALRILGVRQGFHD